MITILVPTDFSPSAKNALLYAIAIAKKAKAKVIILHVYHAPVSPGRTPHLLNYKQVRENVRMATQQLKELEDTLEELTHIEYRMKIASMHWVVEFPEVLKIPNADLIIMGTNGASGIRKMILGSNTATVIENATRPVLAIPKQNTRKTIKNIAFAYDQELIEDIGSLDFLVSFARLFNAQVQIFHVKKRKSDIEESVQVINEQKIIDHLGYTYHSYSECYEDSVEEGIEKYLKANRIDILAMMSRNRSLFHRLFKSSYTQKMAFQTKTPLLVLPESRTGA